MTLSTRMNLVPPYDFGKYPIEVGLAPKERNKLNRIVDLILQSLTNPLFYLQAAGCNLCNHVEHNPENCRAQKTQIALYAVAQSSQTSQRFTQLLFPELDFIWPKLNVFFDLSTLKLDEIKTILARHLKGEFIVFDSKESSGFFENVHQQEDVGQRLVQMVQIMLVALVKSCRFRILSICHLQTASLCSSFPTCENFVENNLRMGLRAAIITHIYSARSAAACGLILFPTGAIGGIGALQHVQEKTLERLTSADFDCERRLAVATLQKFYIARVGVALSVLVDRLLKIKRVVRDCRALLALKMHQIYRVALQLMKSIIAFAHTLTTKGGPAKNSSKNLQELKERLLTERNGRDIQISPRSKLEKTAQRNSLGILSQIVSPESSPNATKALKVSNRTLSKRSVSKAGPALRRSHSETALFTQRVYSVGKGAKRKPLLTRSLSNASNLSKIGEQQFPPPSVRRKIISSEEFKDLKTNRPELSIAAHWGRRIDQ